MCAKKEKRTPTTHTHTHTEKDKLIFVYFSTFALRCTLQAAAMFGFLFISRVAFNYIASLINGLHKFTAIETGRCAKMRENNDTHQPAERKSPKNEEQSTK